MRIRSCADCSVLVTVFPCPGSRPGKVKGFDAVALRIRSVCMLLLVSCAVRIGGSGGSGGSAVRS